MLPIKLPENINLKTKGNPLDHQVDWSNIEINNEKCRLETDTLRYICGLFMVFPSFLFTKK